MVVVADREMAVGHGRLASKQEWSKRSYNFTADCKLSSFVLPRIQKSGASITVFVNCNRLSTALFWIVTHQTSMGPGRSVHSITTHYYASILRRVKTNHFQTGIFSNPGDKQGLYHDRS
jgi:hypothetical protein